MTEQEIFNILHKLAQQGITTSICYGPCGNHGLLFSVNVLTLNYESFEEPFAANTLSQSAEIALKECIERGWFIENAT